MSIVRVALLCLALETPQPDQLLTAPLQEALESAAPTQESARELWAAIESAELQAPSLASQPDALALLDRARLVLVSIYLATDERRAAELAMDEAIRSAMGRSVAAGSFGPAVLELYEQRLLALESQAGGTLVIDCQSCSLIINETAVDGLEHPLPLGLYRVWVLFDDPERAAERVGVELDTSGGFVRHDFAPEPRPRPETALRDEPPPAQDSRGRLLPRWSELLGLGAGAAVLIGGAALASLHGKCRGDARGGDLQTCPELYENRPQDAILLSLGAGVMLASGVVLTLDEVRVGRVSGRRATLTWTLRF